MQKQPKHPSGDAWINICGILTESHSDTSYNMDEPWKHYAKWKELGTKDPILYDSIYRKCSEKANL